MKRTICALLFALLMLPLCSYACAEDSTNGYMYQYSTTIEKEKPELDEVTKELIAAYRQDPTQENYDRLREQVGINYDKVLAKKQAKLEELKATARDQSKIDEMQVIVDEMIRDRENRIDQTMSRFTDERLRPGSSTGVDGYVPVMGAGKNIYIYETPVTNAEYAIFVSETGYRAPAGWTDGSYQESQADFPVVNISLADAEAYCAWLSAADQGTVYRLPTESEWEYAAGHMPKDADMNSGGVENGATPVYAYVQTTGASGAIDLWGNVWEWTSTDRSETDKAVKGGAWNTPKTSCRTKTAQRAEIRHLVMRMSDLGR